MLSKRKVRTILRSSLFSVAAGETQRLFIMNNDRWHIMQIKKAKTADDLQKCIAEIKYDQWEDMPWTKVESKMARVRNFFAYRCMVLGIRQDEVTNGR